MKQWKVSIAGCGGAMMYIHLPVLQKLSNIFKIVSVYEPDPFRMDLLKTKIGQVSFCDSFDELLESPAEVVIILSHNHESQIEQSLLAGKHVFTEKPISLDLSYSNKLKNIAVSNNLILEVGLMRLYDPIINDVFQQLSLDTIQSCILYKSDGSDSVIRQTLMPQSMCPYNFHKSNPPILPKDLSEKQISVLKTLLWSGIHLLTTICEKFPTASTDYCQANDQGSVISSVLKTQQHQHIILNLNNSYVPTYSEGIKFSSEHVQGMIEFSSPYILGGLTKGVIAKADLNFTMKEEIFKNYKSAFLAMWEYIYLVLERRKKSLSLDLALRVEELARNISKSCN